MIREDRAIRQLFGASFDRSTLGEFLRRLDVVNWFYQSFRPTSLYTIDEMPEGFLQAYYGADLDDGDPIAAAIRARLPICSFAHARKFYAESAEDSQRTEEFLEKWGIFDGVFVTTGTEDHGSVLVMIVGKGVGTKFATSHSRLLRHLSVVADTVLDAIPPDFALDRRRWPFTAREQELLDLALSGTCNTLTQQAVALGISESTVKQRRSRICKRVGVRSWPGVLVRVGGRL
jgi:DNA-binding CsgD family transcriptional regulator